jgi:hypothetical protein
VSRGPVLVEEESRLVPLARLGTLSDSNSVGDWAIYKMEKYGLKPPPGAAPQRRP